jgi:two-component system, OmpR family, response regulator MprA
MDNKFRILVADDDPEILKFLSRGLAYEGYIVDTAIDGNETLQKVRDTEPALIILDIMMPGIDGIEVSKRLRQVNDIPILMLTAKGTLNDRVSGLDSGADDYLIKPFEFNELLARIRALLRRRQPKEKEILRFSDLSLDTSTREVKRGEDQIHLSLQEYDLLELFMRHPKQVLTREIIYDKIWGYNFEGESNVIEVYISYLRAKLQKDNRPELVHTVRGVGYVLKE